jgi:hypothetical protein
MVRGPTCVILQPSYIPWRGYFHQIEKADLFVFYDDVQYDKHGWRNRNKIKTAQGSQWLTIPVHARGASVENTAICAVQVDEGQPWSRKHWASIRQAYGKAPFFSRYGPLLESILEDHPASLADFTISSTVQLASELGIGNRRFLRSSALGGEGRKTDRLLDILTKLGAGHYVTGPSARDYLEEEKLIAAGISVEYMTYDYPEYPQLHPPFDPQVSIIDLLMACGPEAPRFIWEDRGHGHPSDLRCDPQP